MDTKALISLWNHTQQHPGTSGARVCASVLLGLYNGARFPMDLTDLRLLDGALLGHALAVIANDATRCQREVHDWFNCITGQYGWGGRFEWLATDYKCFKRGACKLKDLEEQYGPRAGKWIIQLDQYGAPGVVGKTASHVLTDGE